MKYIYFCLIFVLSMPARTVLAQSSQTLCANSSTTLVSSFGSPEIRKTWVNDNPAIGLPASGTGNIANFVVQNNTQTTQVASVTVQAYFGDLWVNNYVNQTPISISGVGNGSPAPSSPYPSTVAVPSGMAPLVAVKVNLFGFSHPSPRDVDILLVAPNGQQTILMSDVGGNTPVSNLNISIGTAGLVYMTATDPLISNFNIQDPYRNYIPTNLNDPLDSPDVFPTPAPVVSSTAASMNPFYGMDPTGIWSLYVVDDQGNNVGTITGGWQLVFTSSPGFGPDESRVFTYRVNPAPAVSLSNNAPQTCAVQLTATSGGSQYAFSTGVVAQGNNTALVSQAGVYSVTLTDANGCSNTASTTVAAGQIIAPTQLPAQAMSVTVPGILGAGNCSVRITGQGQGNLFVVTGPGGYVYSNAYRTGGTYPFVAEDIKQPGTYTLTSSYQNECGQVNSSSRTFTVTGTACR